MNLLLGGEGMALAPDQPGSNNLLVWMQVTEQVGYWVTIVRVKLVGRGGGYIWLSSQNARTQVNLH